MNAHDAELIAKYRAEGFAQGFAQGFPLGFAQGFAQSLEGVIAQAVAQGKSSLLLLQIAERFGDIALHDRIRIQNASNEELDMWGKRLFGATDLGALLDERSSS